MSRPKIKKCALCGKKEGEVSVLVVGSTGQYICSDCIQSCEEILYNIKEQNEDEELSLNDICSAKDIKLNLDKYIIGQEYAKKTLSTLVYNHYKRIIFNKKNNDKIINKSNALILGPTGSGKTYILKTIAKQLNVPLTIVDSTSFSETGYAGQDLENMLVQLCEETDFDIKRAEKGIIFIDEVDKLAKNTDKNSKDIGVGVQQGLLKIIEDSTIDLSNAMKINDGPIINTRDILFIFGGAFEGIEELLNTKENNSIGFNSKNIVQIKKSYKDVTAKHLLKYGLQKEFVGRIPIITYTNELTKQDLKDILTKPKNNLVEQYKNLMKMNNVDITFSNNVLDGIVDKAIKKGLGARALRTEMEKVMEKIMFDYSDNKKQKKLIINDIDNNKLKKQKEL